MQKSLGGFRAALLIGWAALGVAGLLYARGKGIPTWAALPVLAAFLLEYLFYLVPGFESAREKLNTVLPELQLGLFLGVASLLPYLVYSIPTHQFHWVSLLHLAGLAFTISLWYVVFPGCAWADVLFLTLLAGVVLRKFFDPIFTPPVPGLRIEILGQLMLIHLGAMAVLVHRRVITTGFGFLPSRRDWAIGLRYLLLFLPVGFPLALWMHLIRPNPGEIIWWKIIGTFFGILWVVALAEEFFFRGLLQSWAGDWTRNSTAALVLTAVAFGLCHLWFRTFPNWRMALVAAIAGCFYGRAFQRAGSIRAGMVTHAFVVTIWRTVFS
jgi:membrane protease YdiL (CAAX protease family)